MTGGGGSSPRNPPFQPNQEFPEYTPIPIFDLLRNSIHLDEEAYQRSDQDFRQRHRPIVQAERLFQNQVLKDQQGDSTLSPQIQAELTRAGLQGAGSAFGDTAPTLTPGGAGEASVARQLGLGIMGFQDRNRANRAQSLSQAETIFPRRTFGFGGDVYTQLGLADWAGRENHELADYNSQIQLQELNWRNEAQNNSAGTAAGNASAQAEADSTGQIISTVASVIGTVAAAY